MGTGTSRSRGIGRIVIAALAATATFATAASARPVILRSLQMTDAAHGYALDAGSRLLETTDGGRRWRDITPRGAHPTGPPTIAGATPPLSTTLRPGVSP